MWYFIATWVSLDEGEAVLIQVWRQVDAYLNIYSQMVELGTPQPLALEMYFDTWSAFDRQNIRRCDDLKLDKK